MPITYPRTRNPSLLPVLREAKLTLRHFSQYPAVRTIDQFRQPKNRTATPDATLVLNVLILVYEGRLTNCNNNVEKEKKNFNISANIRSLLNNNFLIHF
ncbi:hypothetical protein PUN28_015665 [Cardiocondyla obscurior]|uniref:Uncharacterized protein n=1 Tax=Cardiocondyla obscurior TaxID=286306 RepID=A0AAW2EXE9_9HYME